MPPLRLEGVELNKKVLLSFSAGVDSVVLLDLLIANSFKHIHLVYFDHGLRSSEETDRDKNIVKSAAAQHSLTYTIRALPVRSYAAKYKAGDEQAGRSLRYSFLKHFVRLFDAQCSLTAHHLSDSVEQKLMGVLKGSISSCIHDGSQEIIGGMRVVRPLREWSKADILDYANENGLVFHDDSSNLSLEYSRNKFRHTVMGPVNDFVADAELNVDFVFNELARTHNAYYARVHDWLKGLTLTHFPVELDISELSSFNEFELNDAIKGIFKSLNNLFEHLYPSRLMTAFPFIRYSRGHIAQVADIVRVGEDTQCHLPALNVFRRGNILAFIPLDLEAFCQITPWKLDGVNGEKELGSLGIRISYCIIENARELERNYSLDSFRQSDNFRVCVDADKVHNAIFSVRRDGDMFTPLGMNSSQNFNHYLINQKFSVWKRDLWPLLRMGGEVLWIPGLQISDRVKITDQTTRFLVMECGKLN